MLIVITGGPSSGKTTLIEMLKSAGYAVLPEIARQVIAEGKLSPQADRDSFEREVFQRQLAAEGALPESAEPVFLDNSGILDAPAFYAMDGLETPAPMLAVDLKRYARVFLLDPLPFFEEDGTRFEGLEFTQKITARLEEIVLNAGLPLVRIPAVSKQERLELLRQNL